MTKLKIENQIKKWYNLAPKYKTGWNPVLVQIRMCISYLALRYKMACVPVAVKPLMKNELDETIYELTETIIYREGENLMDNITNKFIVEKMADCIMRDSYKPFAVPVDINFRGIKNESHANMLIYNSTDFLLEHFEPHGIESESNKYTNAKNNLSKQLKNLVEYMNHEYMRPNNFIDLKFVDSNQSCPTGFGLQHNNQEDMYCLAWSFMIAELHLMYPEYKLIEIQEIIKKTLEKNDNYKPETHNIKLVRGYIVALYDNIVNYLGLGLGIGTKINEYKLFNPWSKTIANNIQHIFAGPYSNGKLTNVGLTRFPPEKKQAWIDKLNIYEDNNEEINNMTSKKRSMPTKRRRRTKSSSRSKTRRTPNTL